jgi:K+-sensing histidine kinase KdpD
MAHRFLKSCLGIVLCTSSAALLSVFQINTADFRTASLGVSLFAVAMTAWLFGRWPALIGSTAVTVTLAIWVFPPAGSFAIQDRAELQALLLFQVAAIATALMRSGNPRHRSTPKFE